MTRGVAINLVGRTFGEWKVIRHVPSKPPHFRGQWLCRCSCGTKREIYAHSLLNGTSKSCGCTRALSSHKTWTARRARQDLLEVALTYVDHKEACEFFEWSDPADYITTSFGFVITAETCKCGVIELACQLDPNAGARVASDGSTPKEISCTR